MELVEKTLMLCWLLCNLTTSNCQTHKDLCKEIILESLKSLKSSKLLSILVSNCPGIIEETQENNTVPDKNYKEIQKGD
jgi:hypothetical protein